MQGFPDHSSTWSPFLFTVSSGAGSCHPWPGAQPRSASSPCCVCPPPVCASGAKGDQPGPWPSGGEVNVPNSGCGVASESPRLGSSPNAERLRLWGQGSTPAQTQMGVKVQLHSLTGWPVGVCGPACYKLWLTISMAAQTFKPQASNQIHLCPIFLGQRSLWSVPRQSFGAGSLYRAQRSVLSGPWGGPWRLQPRALRELPSKSLGHPQGTVDSTESHLQPRSRAPGALPKYQIGASATEAPCPTP